MAHNDSLPPSDRDEQPAAAPKPDAKTYGCNELIRQKLRELRASSRAYSNTELGKKLGYSSAVLSQYLSDLGNKWKAVSALEIAAEDFLKALERRRASGVETHSAEVADQMLAGFEYIRKTNDLGVIIADSGEGKTRGIELITKAHPLARLTEITEWTRSAHDIMRALWKVSDVDGWHQQSQQFPYLVQKTRGSDIPFIFDDAHKATKDGLSLIATFQEKTGSPVILIALPEILKKLEADPQLLSRTGICYAIERTKKGDSDLLIHMVRSIAKDINGELDQLVDLCSQVEAHQGHKRSVHKQLKVAAELRHADDSLSWCDAFRGAHKLLLRPYQLS